jgi:predicted membrane channel-forming protein YqfA (hemolysin III family)
MQPIRVMLTAIFSIFSALGIATVLMGKAPVSALIIVFAYLATAVALNGKGGKPSKYLAFFTCFVLSLGCIGAIYALSQPLLGEKFEPLLFSSALVIGLIGLVTIKQLKKAA